MIIKSLTIAIVTYKRKKKLDSCLKSIFIQKNHPRTILLIDNDFKKSSYNLYKKYKNKISIQYLNEPIKGISNARNLAIKNCQTKFLAFVDDDCILSPKWTEIAKKIIKSNPKSVFFQGHSSASKNLNNPLIFFQNKNYQSWIKSNIKKNNYYNPEGIDTKNIILNIDKIKKLKIKFDQNFPIFEDIDFGLQIKKNFLKGKFVPEMSVFHEEINSFKKIIKKNYFRGKIKYYLNQKWNNFDHFSPNILKTHKNFYQNVLNQSFNFGFLIAKCKNFKPPKNTIFIINNLDHGANEERTVAVSNFLKQKSFSVNIIDSKKLVIQNINNLVNFFRYPLIYFKYRLFRILISKLKISKFKPHLLYWQMIFRGKLIKNYLIKNHAKIVISQYSEDIFCALNPKPYKIILDIPTIFSEEIKFKYPKNKKIINKIEKLEKNIFRQNNSICFHWYSFLNLAKKINKKPKNDFILNWGCSLQKQTAKFENNAKIIYLGNLNDPWINSPLLESIQQNSIIPLDIYSYEKPNKKIYKKLETNGFMKNLKNISNYQFGLLTFTDDQLRNNGFSAKHLMYLSFGLPVLCPEWRKDKLLAPATIYYNQKNFNQEIKKYSLKKNWLKKHHAALKIAKKMQWSKNLIPLLEKIYIISE